MIFQNRTMDRTLWLAVFALLCAGLVMVYSTSFIFAADRYKDGLFFFKRHLLFAGIGVAALLAGWRIPVSFLKRMAIPAVAAVTVLLILTLIPGISHHVGGASRWIKIFNFRFQPGEIAKIAVLLYVALQLERKLARQENWRTGFLCYFIGLVPVYALLLFQPDFGTAMLCLFATLAMLLASGVKLRYLATMALIAAPAAAALVLSSGYRKARLLGFLDPWSDPAAKGFQVIQSFLAFFSGKLYGVGLGNSRAKLFYLPEAHNDFIFSVIGEELGLFGVVFFAGLFLVVVLRGLRAAEKLKKDHRTFECGLASGITSLIGLQAFFNMGVVLGLLPTKGMPLPLVSYGGTSLIVSLFLLGVLAQLSEKAECG